jgi:hypothetical protein
MDVIGVGFGRTGTLSLKAALETLGFGPCVHMLPLFGDPERAALFHKAATGDTGALEAALAGHRSTVDWPGTYFWRDLVERYPTARIVLTTRDPQRWYDSAHRTIFAAAHAPAPDHQDPEQALVMAMAHAVVWDGQFGGRFGDREHAVRVFEEHNEAVRRTVAADRLLEFQVGAGWEPLCAFLDRPVPAEPFPRLNDAEQFLARTAHLHRR